MLDNIKIGIIGMGNMGESILRGLLARDLNRKNISFFDRDSSRRRYISEKYKISTSADNADLMRNSEYVIISVKPQDIFDLLKEIKSLHRGRVIISIAAGITLKRISDVLGRDARLVRVMPNVAAITGDAACGIYISSKLSEEEIKSVVSIFSAIGRVAVLKDETLLDVVTGLSGSGPAYVFMMMEALADAGVRLGLPRSIARLLTIQTILGSAKIAMDSDKHFAELKDIVTSPGGTTMAGLKILEEKGFRSAIMDAVEAATKRARELLE